MPHIAYLVVQQNSLSPAGQTMRTSRYGSTVILSASSGSIPVSRTIGLAAQILYLGRLCIRRGKYYGECDNSRSAAGNRMTLTDLAQVADRLGIGVDGAQFADGLCRAVHQALRRRGDRTNRAAGARELAAALVACGRCLRRRSATRARRLALLRLVDGRRLSVALSEAATRVAPTPPVPQGVRRRHPLSCLPHHRQDALVELLGEDLDAIDVSRAGKTVGRTIVLPANPGRLLTAPDSWTVSSVARHGPTSDNACRVLRSTR